MCCKEYDKITDVSTPKRENQGRRRWMDGCVPSGFPDFLIKTDPKKNLELKNSGLNFSLPDTIRSINARRARRVRPTLPQASCFLEFQILFMQEE